MGRSNRGRSSPQSASACAREEKHVGGTRWASITGLHVTVLSITITIKRPPKKSADPETAGLPSGATPAHAPDAKGIPGIW